MKQTERPDLARELIKHVVFRLDENLRMVNRGFEFLREDDLWKRPNEASNSIGNMVIHLCGNITQYVLSGLGGLEDLRQRDQEFTIRGGYSKSQVLGKLTALTGEAKDLVSKLTEEQLTRHYRVQGFDLSGAGILLHVVEHFSYHTGQIAFYIKSLQNEDLDFYGGLNLNQKNKT